ncbi:MAG TPA: thioredoxin domain-containing protein [Polyangiaceae bacterium]
MTNDQDTSGINHGVAIIGFVVSFVAGAGLMWGYDAKHGVTRAGETATADRAGGGWSDDSSPIPVDAKDPVWGNRNALVTVVEFSDFQCPYCSRGENVVKQIKDTYGPDKVRIVWKNEPLPFHPNAKPAAEAAEGVFELAGTEAFWKFHDTAFKNQSALGTDSYVKWAQEAGVKDIERFKAGLAAHTWAAKVDKDDALIKAVGQGGTPNYYINGVNVMGAQPFDSFKTVIDQELSKAQAKVAKGTPKDQLYVAASLENKKNAPPPPPPAQEKPAEDPNAVHVVALGSAPAEWNDKGDKTPVTIVEFSDFECPFCKRAHDTMEKLHAQYGDKVRLVFKNAPIGFHKRAEPSAELALEARAEKGDKGFWKAHDALFTSSPSLDDAAFDKIATEVGLNPDKVHDAVNNHKWKKAIDDDAAQAAGLQANALPHFFINGRRLVGAQPIEAFQKVIDEEIAKGGTAVAKR